MRNILQKAEFASLDEIAQQVDASVSTVRRDVTIWRHREPCGAPMAARAIVVPRSDEFTFSARDTHQLAEKEAIGRACAELIQPNQSVILDAGHHRLSRRPLSGEQAPQIITNSLPVANLFASANRLEVVVSGGVIYPRLGVLVGPLAVEAFTKMHADVAIMSAGGISLEGITNSHGLLIDIQTAMIQGAQRVIFCFDHTKFGRQSVLPLCGLDSVDTIVTDSGAPSELVAALRERGLEVVVAPEA